MAEVNLQVGKKSIRGLTETECAVMSVLVDRWTVGRTRYGEGISYKQGPRQHQKNIENWINQAIEECADQLQYLVALKMVLQRSPSVRKRARKGGGKQ